MYNSDFFTINNRHGIDAFLTIMMLCSHPVTYGISQCSVLVPLLFNIYINDITEASTKFGFIISIIQFTACFKFTIINNCKNSCS